MIDLRCGDCLGELRTLADASVDAVVTDPPAGIGFMGQDWDHDRGGRVRWIGWLAERLAGCLRVARPGAHALVWALPRTSHLTGVAIEDAGWVIEDRIAHVFGQGFPKHKSKLKPAVEDWWLCTKPGGAKWLNVDGCRIGTRESLGRLNRTTSRYIDSSNGSREPHERTVWVDNSTGKGRWPPNLVLTHHPDCRPCGERRVKGSGFDRSGRPPRETGTVYGDHKPSGFTGHADPDGLETVPAWQCVAGCPVAELDRQSGKRKSGEHPANCSGMGYGSGARGTKGVRIVLDSGGASRFFPTFSWTEADLAPFRYCPKASRRERGEGNGHPTVKPLALMRWLCRLITPPGGVILDPFAGSGTSGLAAEAEGFDAVLIERQPEYLEIARRRLAAATAGAPLFAALP